MRIILASEVIHPGGAETFILRLAQALHEQGHDVRVFVFYEELLNYNLCKIFAPDVQIVPATIPSGKLLQKADGALFRLGIDKSFRNAHIKKSLHQLIKEHQPDVIHSHLLKVDALCLDVAAVYKIPVVNTIHGDYLQFYNKTKAGTPIPLLNYTQKAPKNLKRLAHTVVISNKQIQFFKDHFPNETNGKITKIYNGYRGNITEPSTELKKQLGIKNGDFVFGMVSRGIPEKGWQIAIDAFMKLYRPDTHLILTGSSDYLDELKAKYNQHKNIHFTGHADNPINWVNVFDVGLLPSTYPSESLPTVVIEYLYCNAPVIASDAGEIIYMTGQGETPAALITPIKDGTVNVKETEEAMSSYLNNKELYNQHKINAAKCYGQFDMNKCVAAYTTVYQSAANNKA